MTAYLVTGGCGFVGSHLVDTLLAAGHSVRILDDLSTGRRENVPAVPDVVVGDAPRSSAAFGMKVETSLRDGLAKTLESLRR